MNTPLVSVVLPNYKHAPYLTSRIESILQQTFQDFELIMLDDASNDNSIAILEKYATHPKVSFFIKNNKNSGSTFIQWKKGLSKARGKYIWLAESDDLVHPDFLAKTTKTLLADSRLSLCYTQSIRFDDVPAEGEVLTSHTAQFEPNIWYSDFRMEGSIFLEKYLLHKNVIPNASAVLFKRDALDMSWFEELQTFRMLGDWCFWSQLATRGDVAFLSAPLNYFRSSPNSTRQHDSFQKIKKRYLEELRLRKILHRSNSLSHQSPSFLAHFMRYWLSKNGLRMLKNALSNSL